MNASTAVLFSILLPLALGAVRIDQIPVPAPLAVTAAGCRNVELIPHAGTSPFLTLNVLQSRDGGLSALFFVARFTTKMPLGSDMSSALYYQFDDQAPAYVETMSPSVTPSAYFERLVFGKLTMGPHRLAYGILSLDGGFISYGQRCFTVKDLKYQRFKVTGPA